jgi:hypothetical protein
MTTRAPPLTEQQLEHGDEAAQRLAAVRLAEYTYRVLSSPLPSGDPTSLRLEAEVARRRLSQTKATSGLAVALAILALLVALSARPGKPSGARLAAQAKARAAAWAGACASLLSPKNTPHPFISDACPMAGASDSMESACAAIEYVDALVDLLREYGELSLGDI